MAHGAATRPEEHTPWRSSPSRGDPSSAEEAWRSARHTASSILAAGVHLGLGPVLLTFSLYMSGVVEPAVPIRDLPAYWTLSVDEYLSRVNADFLHRRHELTGWWWLSALGNADFMSFLGVAVLSTVTLVCFLGIIPTLLGKQDWVYAAMAGAEVVILMLAASGLLTAGH